MKANKSTITLIALFISTFSMAQTEKIMYQCNFDCPSCEEKVMKNIPYEKGVKAVEVFYGENLVTVEFKESKNTTEGIQKALVKLGYNTQVMGTPTTFGVKGNCGICKEKIETAAKSVDGVNIASWNANKQQITIALNSNTDINTVHKAIAKIGYDTDLIKTDEETYKNLHHCCKYER